MPRVGFLQADLGFLLCRRDGAVGDAGAALLWRGDGPHDLARKAGLAFDISIVEALLIRDTQLNHAALSENVAAESRLFDNVRVLRAAFTERASFAIGPIQVAIESNYAIAGRPGLRVSESDDDYSAKKLSSF